MSHHPAGSAKRPIPAPVPIRDDLGMDEPTLDCFWCGRPAVVEYRVERLGDDATWHTARRWVACQIHQPGLELHPDQLAAHDRLVVQTCG